MLRQVPAHRLYMGKRILQVKEKDDKMVIQCSDNTDYDCDILVGADGAYSATRQNVYREMEAAGKLPKSDQENLVAAFICMVGVTDPLDPEEYPELKDPFVHHKGVQGGNGETVRKPDFRLSLLLFLFSEHPHMAVMNNKINCLFVC